ncbi:ATP-binding protein [Curtobacterium sp. PhB25]|uniref:AAA family ATPase n=1 Tax=Curtobacterium sp. PhB25 TaxID=2485205 RepID=UPI001416F9F7|nr:ATP-binding protein [Curtobacterium sp. PhB25]
MITTLRIRNFKSFVNESVSLSPFTMIIGGNGAGKSNFFDALRFLKSIGENRPIRDAIEGHAPPGAITPTISGIRGGGANATHFLADKPNFLMEVEVQLEDPDETIFYMIEVDAQRHRVVNEHLSSSAHPGQYVFSTQPETGPLENNPDAPSIAARFHKNSPGLNPKREFSPNDFILSQFVSRRAESRQNEEVADRLRTELASISPLELQPDVLRRYAPIGRFEMGEHGENFAAAVWKLNYDAETPRFYLDGNNEAGHEYEYDEDAISRRDAVLAWLNQVTPRPITALEAEASPTNEVVVTVHEEPYRQPIAAPSLSDGTLRFAALALASVGQRGRRTLLIEEVENGINPSRIALLVSMLEQVTASDSNVQVFASTHSPSILDYLDHDAAVRSVVIGWNPATSSSQVRRLGDLPGLKEATKGARLGDLQEEGWLQEAAGL